MQKKIKKYFKVSAHFRSERYQCIIICESGENITGDIVAGFICKKFTATIPQAEISFTKTETSLISTLLVHNMDTYELAEKVAA